MGEQHVALYGGPRVAPAPQVITRSSGRGPYTFASGRRAPSGHPSTASTVNRATAAVPAVHLDAGAPFQRAEVVEDGGAVGVVDAPGDDRGARLPGWCRPGHQPARPPGGWCVQVPGGSRARPVRGASTRIAGMPDADRRGTAPGRCPGPDPRPGPGGPSAAVGSRWCVAGRCRRPSSHTPPEPRATTVTAAIAVSPEPGADPRPPRPLSSRRSCRFPELLRILNPSPGGGP